MSRVCQFTGKKPSVGKKRVWRGQAIKKGGFGLKPTGITRRTFKPNLQRIQVIDGLARRCASQEGNALAVACRLGMAHDPRAELLARSLAGWQWPDGGWNCDPRASGRRSSFHESLAPA